MLLRCGRFVKSRERLPNKGGPEEKKRLNRREFSLNALKIQRFKAFYHVGANIVLNDFSPFFREEAAVRIVLFFG